MADVFVSYAHVDDARVRDIVAELEKHSLTVWWDIALRSGQRYGDVIENELRQAKCVLAVWSRNARASDWVRAEASIGNDQDKLVQIVLHKGVSPPLPFNIIHYEPIEGAPSDADENWRQLIDAIGQRVGGAAAPRAPARAPNPLNAASVFSALSAAAMLAYLAALNTPAVANALSSAVGALADPVLVPLYAATALGAASLLMTVQQVLAKARAGG